MTLPGLVGRLTVLFILFCLGLFSSLISIMLITCILSAVVIAHYKGLDDSGYLAKVNNVAFPIMIGSAFLLDSIRMPDWNNARELGIALLLWPMANAVRKRIIQSDGYLIEFLTFAVLLVICASLSNWIGI